MIHFLRADFGHSCNFLQYFKKDKTLNTFSFQLKDLLPYISFSIQTNIGLVPAAKEYNKELWFFLCPEVLIWTWTSMSSKYEGV